MIKSLSVCTLTALLFGCAAKPPRTIDLVNQFNPAEVAWASRAGTGKILGSAVIQTAGGIPRTCAGKEVNLIPVSAYSSERMYGIYGGVSKGFVPTSAQRWNIVRNVAYESSVRKATCDAQGSFEFDELPSGSYFINTTVIWSTGRQYEPPTGGGLMLNVTVNEGKSIKAVLTP